MNSTKYIFQHFSDLTWNRAQITCLTVRHLNHYIKWFFYACVRLLLDPIHVWVILSHSSYWTKRQTLTREVTYIRSQWTEGHVTYSSFFVNFI